MFLKLHNITFMEDLPISTMQDFFLYGFKRVRQGSNGKDQMVSNATNGANTLAS
jgi:hypothetical protein